MQRSHFVGGIFTTDFHRHLFGKFWVIDSAEQVVKRSQMRCTPEDCFAGVKQRKILAVGIMIANQVIKNHRIEQRLQIADRRS